MTADEQVERVAKALSAHWNNMHTNESMGKQRMLARAAIAAMKPEPVTVTTVEELEALPNWTIAQQDIGTVLEQRSRDGGPAAWYGHIGGRMLHGESSQWVADKITLGSEYPVTVFSEGVTK